MPYPPQTTVIDINNPGRIGVTTGVQRSQGGINLIQVVYGTNERVFVPEQFLQAYDNAHRTLEAKIADGKFGKALDLKRLITFEKLRGSLHDFIYSMEAAEIEFMEYQFKPVLKFVESPTERLLIADEVGLGKTIEAALIWLELQARRDARRLLVVCPKMIARKWRRELREKFSIPAEVGDLSNIRQAMNDFKRQGNSLRFAWICTYSSLRPPRQDLPYLSEEEHKLSVRGELIRELNDWSSEVPFCDLVIFDEAHYMRNPASSTSKLGSALANATAAMLCVSATPVNNTNTDLFTLLRLLDPDFFENDFLFQSLLEENRPAVQGVNALMRNPPKLQDALLCIEQLKGSEFVGRSDLLARLNDHLSALEPGDLNGILNAQEMFERLNILGSYISRTRRTQVKEHRAVRSASVVPVKLTEVEFNFYKAITQMVRLKVAKAGKTFSAFHLVMPQQRMASCIPAMFKAYKDGDFSDWEEVLSESFDVEQDELWDNEVSEDDSHLAEIFKQFRTYDFEANDSKYAQLREILKNLGNEKVIIFSYFKGTLFYLQRRLAADGIECALIHGGIHDQDVRDDEIARFSDKDGARVLLSSEVGSEGIDLQFCHVIVNYDLPWNPMRVEQRIGRIDRVGQEADKLIIVHFKILNTIEERLYTRLHEKLLLFENSIGDLEPVIGKEIQGLTMDLLSKNLTPAEEEERIAQTERVLAARLKAIEELEKSGESLMAHADFIASKVSKNRDLGRYVTADDLQHYISDFFEHNYPGCRLQWDYVVPGAFRLELTFQAHDKLTDFLHEKKIDAPAESYSRIMIATLRPELAKQRRLVNQRRLILLNHLSPLIRWITHENQHRRDAFYDVSTLKLHTDKLTPGQYAYRIERWRFTGLRNKEVLSYAVGRLSDRVALKAEEAEQAVHHLLQNGEDWLYPTFEQQVCGEVLVQLRDSLQDRFDLAFKTFEAENQTLYEIQKAQIQNHFRRRLELDNRRLETLQARGRSDRMVKLTQARIAKDSELERQKIHQLESKAAAKFDFQEICAGLFLVEA